MQEVTAAEATFERKRLSGGGVSYRKRPGEGRIIKQTFPVKPGVSDSDEDVFGALYAKFSRY